MAPKKLTDCPENLREAIDWLIQVRHGSNNGLEELAKALKKSIEEAIEKAYTTNVDALLKALGPFQSYKCCKDKVAAIEKLKEAKTNAIYSFDEIKSQCVSIRDCTKTHLDDSQQKSYDEIKSKLGQRDRLNESLIGLTNENQCKELLENLCTGLETFLGFNSASKGYTGQGIVYSDLDRLCDGVMGFLSGVLSNIKDHLGQHKDKIEPVIKVLEQNKHRGKEGFNDAIGKVAQRVREYNEKVKRSNDDIKNPIRTLLRQIGEKGELYKGLNALQVPDARQQAEEAATTAEKLVETYIQTSKKFETDHKCTTKHISDLNLNCKTSVNHAYKNVKYETKRLEELSAKELQDMKEMLSLITSTLDGIRDSIIAQINTHVNELVNNLKGLVQNTILNPLNDINEKLKEYIQTLRKWIAKTNVDIDSTLKIVENILNEVNSTGGADKLQKLEQAIQLIEAGLQSRVAEVTAWKAAGAEAVKKAKEKCDEISGMVVTTGTTNGKIHGIAKEMRDKAEDLRKAAEHIKDNINGWIQKATQAVDHLENAVRMDLWSVKDTLESKILGYIRDQVNAIVDAAKAATGNWNPSGGQQGVKALQLSSKLKGELKNLLQDGKLDEHIAQGLEGALNLLKVYGGLEQPSRANPKPLNPQPLINAIYGDIQVELENRLPKMNDDGTYEVKLDKFKKSFYNTNPGGENGTKKAALTKSIQKIETNVNQKLRDDTGVRTTIQGKTNSFIQPFSEITDQLNEIAGLVDSDKRKQKPGDGEKNGVNNYLDDITSLLGENSVDLKSNIKSVHSSVQGLEKIKREIQKLKDTNVADVKGKLQALCEAIRTSAREVKSDLKRLKENNLNYELEEMKENLYKLQLKLQRGPLKEAKDFMDKHADVFKKRCIDTLTKHVNEQVKEASEKLTYEARKQYISSVKSMLEAFVGKVGGELKTVLREINHDVHMSHKKFMNSIGDTFISKIKAINDVDPKGFDAPKSPLSSAAGILNDALQSLLKELKQQKDFAPDIRKIDPSTTALQTVLEKLVKSKHFDSEFRDNLGVFKNAASAFNPQAYGEGECPPILDALRNGFPLLVKELDKTYVNTYADAQFTDELMEDEKTITKYGKRCAKLCVTLLPSLYDYFTKLREVCKSSLNTTVCKFSKRNDPISIGNFLTTSGYDVAENEESKDGELKRPSVYFTGKTIYEKIFETKYQGSNTIPHLKTCLSNTRKKLDSFDILDILECVIHHIDKYNEVSHIAAASSTKIPSSIYDMLVWCSGLPYNTVYPTMLHETLVDMLSDPNKQKPDVRNGLELTVVNQQTQYLDAHPIKITYDDVVSALDHLCSKSHDVLTRIVGYGDADTIYGSDFCNNSFNLHYPSNAAACFDLLLDILRRLFSTLTFLCQLCSLDASHHGWSECQYGKEFSYGNRDCDQHTGEAAECPPGSPLMLYLTDGLRGYLPHQITNVGCKPKCNTCPKSTPGMPCLTPLGFRGFSGSTKKGRSICDMIREFISHDYLAALLCMLPKAPSTLPEHYSFVLSLSNGISVPKSKKHDSTVTLNEALESSIDSISMSLYTQPNNFTDTLRKAYGDGKANHTWPHPAASNADLASLSMENSCMLPKKDRIHCAPYLLSLSCNTYKYLPQRHVDHYLSCAVYLPWSLYQYLQNLLQAFENISCRDWGCSQCTYGDKCRKGKHGADYGCRCWSAVKCRGVLGVFYTFGFVFKDAEKLLDENQQRYCHDFYNQLSNVLKSQYFQDLFKECDNFLYYIRFPFMSLTLALWSLSLFYLICVMVGRLDLLHVKSHLRIPQSHKITAQSLLAAAQVGRLAKISYLQP